MLTILCVVDSFFFQIEKTYENVDPDLIAMIFHECDYNFQKTITRIQSEDYQVKINTENVFIRN